MNSGGECQKRSGIERCPVYFRDRGLKFSSYQSKPPSRAHGDNPFKGCDLLMSMEMIATFGGSEMGCSRLLRCPSNVRDRPLTMVITYFTDMFFFVFFLNTSLLREPALRVSLNKQKGRVPWGCPKPVTRSGRNIRDLGLGPKAGRSHGLGEKP